MPLRISDRNSRFLAILAQVTWPWDQTARCKYFDQVFIGNYARVRVFSAFDRLSSVTGSKVMIKNKKINYLSDYEINEIFCLL